MNAYDIGRFAAMQKQALSTKGWARLIGAMRKEAPSQPALRCMRGLI